MRVLEPLLLLRARVGQKAQRGDGGVRELAARRRRRRLRAPRAGRRADDGARARIPNRERARRGARGDQPAARVHAAGQAHGNHRDGRREETRAPRVVGQKRRRKRTRVARKRKSVARAFAGARVRLVVVVVVVVVV